MSSTQSGRSRHCANCSGFALHVLCSYLLKSCALCLPSLDWGCGFSLHTRHFWPTPNTHREELVKIPACRRSEMCWVGALKQVESHCWKLLSSCKTFLGLLLYGNGCKGAEQSADTWHFLCFKSPSGCFFYSLLVVATGNCACANANNSSLRCKARGKKGNRLPPHLLMHNSSNTVSNKHRLIPAQEEFNSCFAFQSH